MKTALRVANARVSQLAAFGGAVIVAVAEFGVELTDGQERALYALLFTAIALLAGRDIGRAERRPPPS